MVLEDIQSYQNLERIQMLLKSKNELEAEYINGNYTIKNGRVSEISLSTKQEKGVGYIKRFILVCSQMRTTFFPFIELGGQWN